MKKSTQVALTLLVPAMTAYGCGNQTKTVQVPANTPMSQSQATMTIPVSCSCGHSFTTSGNMAGKTVQCPKCNQSLTVFASGAQAATHNRSYRSYRSDSYYPRSTYFPWFGGGAGGYSSQTASSPPIASAPHATGTNHASSVSHVSSGGFGGTGAHFSGGS